MPRPVKKLLLDPFFWILLASIALEYVPVSSQHVRLVRIIAEILFLVSWFAANFFREKEKSDHKSKGTIIYYVIGIGGFLAILFFILRTPANFL